MPNGPLACGEVRRRVPGYLDGGDAAPALAVHLAVCRTCLEACLEAALRRPAEVPVPAGFASRALRLAPTVASGESAPRSLLPYFLAAACVLFVVWGVTVVTSGALEAAALRVGLAAAGRWVPASPRLEAVLSILGLEGVIVPLGFWRLSRA